MKNEHLLDKKCLIYSKPQDEVSYNLSQICKLFLLRFIPYFGANRQEIRMVKSVSMNDNEERRQDAVTLLGLLKRDEDSLIDAGKQIIKQDRDYAREVFTQEVDGWTPFHAFALRGARKMVKLSLRAGVDVNLTMGSIDGLPEGCTALHLAAHRGDVSIINILLSNGANLNAKDDTSRTPVVYASRANNTLAVKTLARAGADMSGCEEHKHSTDEMTSSNIMCFLPFVCAGIRR